jgi:hypothetical protein
MIAKNSEFGTGNKVSAQRPSGRRVVDKRTKTAHGFLPTGSLRSWILLEIRGNLGMAATDGWPCGTNRHQSCSVIDSQTLAIIALQRST